MKNLKRKTISIFLSFVMLFTMLPINSIGVYAQKDKMSKQEVFNTVLSYIEHQDNPHPYWHFDRDELVLAIGETMDINILDKDDKKVDGLDWYIVTQYPRDAIYDMEQTQDDNCESFIKINDDLTITGKEKGEGYILAVYGQYIHRIEFKVTENNQKIKLEKLQAKTDEIIKNITNLSDVEKVLYVFDYLAENIEYDKSYSYKPNAYYALVEGKAVCWGYANAFDHLMKNLGIYSEVIKGGTNVGRHAWNKIKLDGEYYYIDPTWGDDGDFAKYRHFLMDRETLFIDHDEIKDYGNETWGEKYLFYPFKRDNKLVENSEDLDRVVSNIIDTLNRSKYIEILVSDKLTEEDILESFKRISKSRGLGVDVYKTSIITENYNGYNLYKFRVGIRSFTDTKINTTVSAVDFGEDKTTEKLSIILDRNVELGLHNIKLFNAKKENLVKISPNEYELEISNISADNVEIKLNKLMIGQINVNPTSIPVKKVKSKKPEAIFVGINDEEGKLFNVDNDVKYNLGDGNWIEAHNGITIVPKYPYQILLKRIEDGKIESDFQEIIVRKQYEPNWIELVENDNGNEIKNLNTNMEYLKFGENVWNSLETNLLKNVSKGKYDFRMKGKNGYFGSTIVNLVVTKEPNTQNTTTSSGTIVDTENNGNNNQNSDEGSNSNTDTNVNSDENKKENENNNSQDADDNKNDKNDDTKDDEKNSKEENKNTQNTTTSSSTVVKPNNSNKSKRSSSLSKKSSSGKKSSYNVSSQHKNIEKKDNSHIRLSNKNAEIINNDRDNMDIKFSNARIKINEKALKELKGAKQVDIKVTDNTLSKNQKGFLGNQKNARSLGVNMYLGKQKLKKLNNDINISVPYELSNDEDASDLVVWNIKDDDVKFVNSKYNKQTNSVDFNVNELGDYIITKFPFKDVNSKHWGYTDIAYAYNNEIFKGTSKNKFSPDEYMSRAMIATVLYSMDSSPNVEKISTFTDVNFDSWYENAVIWSTQSGIISGYGDGKFGVNDTITREQLVTMLYKYSKAEPILEDSLSNYDDRDNLSEYARESMNWAINKGLVRGISDNEIGATGKCTRAQVATILRKFIQMKNK